MEDAAALDEYFLEATTAQRGPDATTAVDAVAAALARDWERFRRHTGQSFATQSSGGGKCQPGRCQGRQLRNVRLFARPPPGLQFFLLPAGAQGAMQPVHACSPFCIHTGPVGSQLLGGDNGLVDLLQTSVYTCAAHHKMHICTPDQCREVYTDSLGFGKCVLSGNVITAAEAFSFSDGTGESWRGDLVASETEVSSTGKATKRRKKEPAFLRPEPARNDDDDNAAIGAEDTAPAFDDEEEGNTFGAGLSDVLEELYDASAAAVRLLLFSPERSAIESARRATLEREALRRVKTYVYDELRAGRSAYLDIGQQLYMKILDSRRTFPGFQRIGPQAIARFTAYYSMVIVECNVAIARLANDLYAMPDLRAAVKAGDRASGALERIHSYRAGDMACNLLMLLATDFAAPNGPGGGAFWPQGKHDPILAWLPESNVADRLGFSEKTCTEIKKDIKCIISLAQGKNIDLLARLRGTELPLYYGHMSASDDDGGGGGPNGLGMVAAFLQQRRTRLHANQLTVASARSARPFSHHQPNARVSAAPNDDDDDETAPIADDGPAWELE